MADDVQVKEAKAKRKADDAPAGAPIIHVPPVEPTTILARKIGRAVGTTLTLQNGRTFAGLKAEIPVADFEILRDRGLVTEA